MRSAPALAAASNTRRDPSTLIVRVWSPEPMIEKARCTTTWAPFTASRTLAASCTSPWRYSVFFQPCSAGSNSRRAIPTIRLTPRERSSAETMAMPRSPVGPVTATVSPSAAIGADPMRLEALLASLEYVDSVGLHAVLALAAVDDVACAVAGVDLVAAGAG